MNSGALERVGRLFGFGLGVGVQVQVAAELQRFGDWGSSKARTWRGRQGSITGRRRFPRQEVSTRLLVFAVHVLGLSVSGQLLSSFEVLV